MEKTKLTESYKDKIITIPNLLSFFRICLLPLIVFLYITESYSEATIAVLISGFTDILDGFIARTFNMISDFGKVLDPIADKLTQWVIMLLLSIRFPLMLLPALLLPLKELFMAATGILIVKKSGVVLSAEWHGKIATLLLTVTTAAHIFWYSIPKNISDITIYLSSFMIIISFVLYADRNMKHLGG